MLRIKKTVERVEKLVKALCQIFVKKLFNIMFEFTDFQIMKSEEEKQRVSKLLFAITSRGLLNEDCPSVDVFDKVDI